MISIRPITDADRVWMRDLLVSSWGMEKVVSRGYLRDVTGFDGFIAWIEGERVGLVTLEIHDSAMELVTIDSLRENIGVGAALLDAVVAEARKREVSRLWLITTNDNLRALKFYQKRGWRLSALHVNALDESRRLKPSIPLIGTDGIPLRDELELEYPL